MVHDIRKNVEDVMVPRHHLFVLLVTVELR